MSEQKIELTITKSRAVKIGEDYVRAEYTLKAVNLDPDELDVARATLEGKIDVWLGELKPVAPAPTPTPVPTVTMPTPVAQAPVTAPHPSTYFPEDLASLLTFEEKKDCWIIKPRSYLGSENFAKIADIVRKHQGEYISAGKESHFKLPKGA